MSENNGAAAQTGNGQSSNNGAETKTPGKIVEAGTPTVASFTPRKSEETIVADPPPKKDEDTGGKEQTNENKDQPAELNEEAVKKFFEDKGIKWDGNLDTLKEKLAEQKQAGAEPTEEEKKEAEKKLEQRMFALFEKNGGDMAKFVALKEIAGMENLKDLSVQQIKQELKGKFDDDEINAILVERYYQINPEELEQGVDESDDAFKARKEKIAKKVAHFSETLNSRGAAFRDKAKQALEQLKAAIEAEDMSAQEEVKFSSKVDEHLKTLNRDMTFEIGKVGEVDVDPLNFKISEEDIAEVAKMLKDPEQRKQLSINPDLTDVNLANAVDVLLHKQILKSAVKKALIEGQSRQVAIFEKTFPGRSANEIGVGGTNKQTTSKKGENITAGAPQPVVRQNN